MRAAGSSLERVDAVDKVTGRARYPGDIDLPGQLWLKIRFARVPHARIIDLDTRAAEAAPGVHAILTARDVPVNEYGLIMPDQPVLCGPGSTPQAEFVRWEGDQIAAVIAETPEQAAAASALIRVEWEELPVVTDPLAALEPDSPILHPYEFSSFPYGERDRDSNQLLSYQLRRGDVEAGFNASDVIVESVYRTHAQEHAYLQPEAGLAFLRDDGRVEVVAAGQWMHEDREQIAHALGVEPDEIVVRYPAIGGAFGGREDLSLQIVLALATRRVGRPVKTIWSREESIVGHHKRHPFIIRTRWGARSDGRILAAQSDVTSDAGAYAYTSTKVLGNATLMCLGPYEIENVAVDARTVYTNNCPGGAFRGFGAPQGHFAAEMQMNKLADRLGIDPVEIRRRNALRESSILATGSTVPPGCTALEVLEEASRRRRRKRSENATISSQVGDSENVHRANMQMTSLDSSRTRTARGQGIALCFKNVGFSLGFPEHCHAWVELEGGAQIERARVGCVGAEVGQGAHTVFVQIASEILDIAPERIELMADDTDVTGSSGSSSASRMTFMAGSAIEGAARRALRLWDDEERPARADFVFHPRPTTSYAPETGESDPNITYGYCAQVADVLVDLETGHVTVERLVSVNDVGRAINPQQVEGQIEGAVAQSVGWTLMENYLQEGGVTRTPYLSNYLIPGVFDVVEEIEPVILEIPDPQGPLGLRGMAEMPFIPTAPAIAAAIYDAVGVWYNELPLTPERIWKGLSQR